MRSTHRIAVYGHSLFAKGARGLTAAWICTMCVPGALWGQFTVNGNVWSAPPGVQVQMWGHLDLINGDGGADSAGITAWNSLRFYSTCCGFTTKDNYGILFQPRDGSAVFKGAVGIGTANLGQCGGSNTLSCLLTVDGAIGAGEIVVTNGITADYVFDAGYRLRPLAEVSAYVKEHHHLPEIPSAAEVKEKGVSLGEMQAKLLAKIEELTLHLIQADERLVRADERLARADEKNRELQERIARLEAGGR